MQTETTNEHVNSITLTQ